MKLNTTSTIALAALLTLATASAQVPAILNYQGRVSIGGSNYNGTGLFKLALVNSNGTATYWNNAGTLTTNEPATAVSLVVTQGLYSVLVGDTSLGNMAAIPQSVFTNNDLRLRVWFSPGADGIFMPFSPDQRLGAAAYAMRATAADNSNPTNISGNLTVTGVLSAGQLIGGSNNTASASYATIGGGLHNTASGDYSAIVGGQSNAAIGIYSTVAGGFSNNATGANATIGAGYRNTNSGASATIGGGYQNNSSGNFATIGGGYQNTNSGYSATIGGGLQNTASAVFATIAGGVQNTNSGAQATIGGGDRNTTSADYATVPGGVRGKATNGGSFVWSGDDQEDTASFGDNTFTVRAEGGARFYTANGTGTGVTLAAGSGTWTSLCDRNAKENFEQVDGTAILAKVAAIPVMTWNYKTQADGIRHIGPSAQDFKQAFGIGETDIGITTVDADGVALAAIQGLVQELKARDARIERLEAELGEIRKQLGNLPPAP